MKSKLNKKLIERFSRQIILKDIGILGQKKILSSKVLRNSSFFKFLFILGIIDIIIILLETFNPNLGQTYPEFIAIG